MYIYTYMYIYARLSLHCVKLARAHVRCSLPLVPPATCVNARAAPLFVCAPVCTWGVNGILNTFGPLASFGRWPQDAQSRLIEKEVEISRLRDRLATASRHAASPGHSPGAPTQVQQQQHRAGPGGPSGAQGRAAGGTARQRPAPLSMALLQDHQQQQAATRGTDSAAAAVAQLGASPAAAPNLGESQDSLPDLGQLSGLPSPSVLGLGLAGLGFNVQGLGSPRSTASFWLGPAGPAAAYGAGREQAVQVRE